MKTNLQKQTQYSQDLPLLDCFRNKFDGVSELVFWSFRYFLGRMTIHTIVFAECLAQAWPFLEQRIQHLIKNELEEEFERDDRARTQGSKWLPLGMDCDRAAWEKVRRCWSDDLPL